MKHFAELFVKGVEEGGHAERQLVKCDRGYEPEDQREQVNIISIIIIIFIIVVNRQELRKFMRETRKSNPAAQCSLQGDKLYIDHKYDDGDDLMIIIIAGVMYGVTPRQKWWNIHQSVNISRRCLMIVFFQSEDLLPARSASPGWFGLSPSPYNDVNVNPSSLLLGFVFNSLQSIPYH